ncbi:MAG: hypothetical protein HY033_11700 [Ignavibacteriae bacterium]|nr:hypothetical protein [Ignavibacteria bacterium]MBI3365562.1 hypothetical protein [Ignavibacteriota bacterium]
MKRTLLCLVVAISLQPVLHAQWEWQYYSPTGNNLNDVEYLPTGVVIAVGEKGIFLRSTDHGVNWTIIESDRSADLFGIAFKDALEGYAFGANESYAKTTDGGLTWSFSPIIDSTSTTVIYDMKFIDANEAWKLTNEYFYHSTNGGQNWSSSPLPPGATPHHLYFRDTQHGWAYGPRTLLQTTNGGAEWNDRSSDVSLFRYNGLTFTDSVTGWISGYFGAFNDYDGYLYKTTDGGATWALNFDVPYAFGTGDVAFMDHNHGWFLTRSRIYGTSDGGASWQLQQIGTFSRISQLDSARAITAGESGQIFRTENGGIAWHSINPASSTYFQKLFFVDSLVGFAATYNQLLKTADGGDSFSPLPQSDVSSMFFTDENHGWIGKNLGGGWSSIFHTTDGGKTWTDQTGEMPYSTLALWFIDDTHGFATGSAGHLMRTSNAGATWNDTTFSDQAEFSSVKFITKDIGWIAGSSIYKTTDGGNTWVRQFVDGVQYFQIEGLSVVTDKTVYAVGQNWMIFKTSDGGNKWTASALPGPGHDVGGWSLNDVWFLDSRSGWIVGNDGLYRSSDGGDTWQKENTPVDRPINSVFFLDQHDGWAAGRAAFFHTSDAGVSTINELSVSTDRITYHTLDTINVTFTYWNRQDTTVVLTFPTGCPYDYCIDSSKCWHRYVACTQLFNYIHVGPHTIHTWNSSFPSEFFDPGLLSEGSHKLVGWLHGHDDLHSSLIDSTIFIISDKDSITINIATGWNLLSFPLDVPDRKLATLFPSTASKAFIYTGTYEPTDSIPWHRGFWVKFDSTFTVAFSGTARVSDTIDVNEGWNLVGTLTRPVQVSDVITIPPDIRISPFFDFKVHPGYGAITVLSPGWGYWVRMKASGKLILK